MLYQVLVFLLQVPISIGLVKTSINWHSMTSMFYLVPVILFFNLLMLKSYSLNCLYDLHTYKLDNGLDIKNDLQNI